MLDAIAAQRRARSGFAFGRQCDRSSPTPSGSLHTSTMSQPAAHAASARATMPPALFAPAMDRSSLKTSPSKSSRRRSTSCSQTREKPAGSASTRSEEHTSELQSRRDLVCRLLLEKKKKRIYQGIFVKKKKHKM